MYHLLAALILSNRILYIIRRKKNKINYLYINCINWPSLLLNFYLFLKDDEHFIRLLIYFIILLIISIINQVDTEWTIFGIIWKLTDYLVRIISIGLFTKLTTYWIFLLLFFHSLVVILVVCIQKLEEKLTVKYFFTELINNFWTCIENFPMHSIIFAENVMIVVLYVNLGEQSLKVAICIYIIIGCILLLFLRLSYILWKLIKEKWCRNLQNENISQSNDGFYWDDYEFRDFKNSELSTSGSYSSVNSLYYVDFL